MSCFFYRKPVQGDTMSKTKMVEIMRDGVGQVTNSSISQAFLCKLKHVFCMQVIDTTSCFDVIFGLQSNTNYNSSFMNLAGSSSWIDFLNPEVRDWWASKFAFDQYKVCPMKDL